MARAVYSVRILAVLGLTTPISYVVPAGYVAVVRDVDVYCNAPLAGARFTFMGSLGQAIYTAVWAPNSTSSQQWRGRQVFVAGESITIKADQATDATVSGYLLTTP